MLGFVPNVKTCDGKYGVGMSEPIVTAPMANQNAARAQLMAAAFDDDQNAFPDDP